MIHPTAVIDKKAEVADDVDIGPYCVIGPEARIGSGTRLVSHVSITGRTDIGTHCTIHPFASLGGDPQDITYKGEDTTCVIGDHNHIGEYVTINKASAKADRVTRVGSRNIIMAYSHIGHDCVVGNEVQMANAATLGGHVHVADFAIVSGLVAVHQFCRIGRFAMVSGLTVGTRTQTIQFDVLVASQAGLPLMAWVGIVLVLVIAFFVVRRVRRHRHVPA